ncbi:helix-turn-helix domain-containing protein [Paucibacter soli]|uniref:helix-turn-helix domain-containing protein n=1 Tax=Paucibacter soli TaxID=3133433 RepID=UPI0030987CAB
MSRVFEHQSQDVDDQAKALNGWRQAYEQLGCGRFDGYAWQLETEEGMLLRERTNRRLREQITPPPEHIALAMPTMVDAGAVFAGRPLGCESLMILTSQDEYDVVTTGELDLVGLCVHRDLLARCLPQAKQGWLEQAERERNLALPPDAAAAIRQQLQTINAQATQQHRHDAQARSDWVSQALSDTVALAMQGDGQDPATALPRRADTRMRVVRRALDFMRANLHNDIGIPEICIAACTSRRSLQYCFEEFLRTTPQAYLRALRLNEARRTLKLTADQPITAVATTLGFSSASHFTRHYRLMFDELPSDTLRLNGPMPGCL